MVFILAQQLLHLNSTEPTARQTETLRSLTVFWLL